MKHSHISLILASTSPRRKELLSIAGLSFTTLAVDIDETWQAGEAPLEYIRRMIAEKAMAAALESRVLLPDLAIILTADTMGVKDGEVLTKPIDQADAYRMWQMLSGSTHEIYTAVQLTLVIGGEITKTKQLIECTEVDFITLTEPVMAEYWQTGEPQDKAGAYAIQGGAMAWVKSIRGSYTNVVGLPLAQVVAALSEFASNLST